MYVFVKVCKVSALVCNDLCVFVKYLLVLHVLIRFSMILYVFNIFCMFVCSILWFLKIFDDFTQFPTVSGVSLRFVRFRTCCGCGCVWVCVCA